MGGFFGRIFLGGFFWEEFFGRNYLVMFLSRFWDNFVSIEGRRKVDFRSLEVRRKLIALKKGSSSKKKFITFLLDKGAIEIFGNFE